MKLHSPDILSERPLQSVGALKRSALTVALLMSVVFSLSAAPVVYQGSYDPAGNPDDRFAPNLTEGGDTDADPVWQWNQTNSPPAPTVGQIGGVYALSYDTTGSNAYVSTWGIGEGQSNTSAWSGTNSVGSTVDFTVRVAATTQGQLNLRVGNEAGYITAYIRNNYTFLNGADGNSTQAVIDTTDFHTYRIALKDGKASLYMDDNATPLVSDWNMSTSAGRNHLLFGDISASTNGKWDMTNISWTNAEAAFSAPIPEPSTALLLGISLAVILMGRKRRRVA